MSEYGAIEKEARIYTELCEQRDRIDPALFDQLGVKRGLRDKDGKGVLTGITNISRIATAKRSPAKASCGTAATMSMISSAACAASAMALRKPPTCC